jgi:hypothetical protein
MVVSVVPPNFSFADFCEGEGGGLRDFRPLNPLVCSWGAPGMMPPSDLFPIPCGTEKRCCLLGDISYEVWALAPTFCLSARLNSGQEGAVIRGSLSSSYHQREFTHLLSPRFGMSLHYDMLYLEPAEGIEPSDRKYPPIGLSGLIMLRVK